MASATVMTGATVAQAYGDTAQQRAAKAREILEARIARGRASALDLIRRVEEEAPEDAIVRSGALCFDAGSGKVVVSAPGMEARSIHRHAMGQMAMRAGVPGGYLRELSGSEDEWQRKLAARILGDHFREGASARYLLRSVRGEARGFLSDKFRRLDSRPLLDTFAEECAKVGAVPVDGTATDTRLALKAILPVVHEPLPGEALAFGVEWSNSDYGNGLHAVRAFMLRVWCLNGATMENVLGQVHLGRQLPDDLELSRRTHDLDTRTSASALKDIIRGTLSERKVEALCEGIRQADARGVEWKHAKVGLGKRLLKGELDKVEAAFEGQDVVNLPAGKTAWRLSNAISWIAGGDGVDAERKLDLQRMAGEAVSGRREQATSEQ